MDLIFIIIIVILALADVILFVLLLMAYRLYNNMQATIIMLKAEVEHYREKRENNWRENN